jgi:hypothetical protein
MLENLLASWPPAAFRPVGNTTRSVRMSRALTTAEKSINLQDFFRASSLQRRGRGKPIALEHPVVALGEHHHVSYRSVHRQTDEHVPGEPCDQMSDAVRYSPVVVPRGASWCPNYALWRPCPDRGSMRTACSSARGSQSRLLAARRSPDSNPSVNRL